MKSIVAPLAALAASLALALHGCGGDPFANSGSGTVTGLVNGSAFTVHDALTTGTTLFNQPISLVVLTDFAGACGVAKANADVKNSGAIAFYLWTNDGSGHITPVTAPGTYTLDDPADQNFPTSGKVGFGALVKNDAVCKATDVATKSGTVTISAIDSAGGFTGTFDLTTTDSVHVTGTFITAGCTFPVSDGGTSACN